MDLKRYEIRGLYSGTMAECHNGTYSLYLEAMGSITKLKDENKNLKDENDALHTECDRLTAILADMQSKSCEEQ